MFGVFVSVRCVSWSGRMSRRPNRFASVVSGSGYSGAVPAQGNSCAVPVRVGMGGGRGRYSLHSTWCADYSSTGHGHITAVVQE